MITKISLITAMDKNGLIGVENKLPWNIPEDLKHFKNLTEGNIVVMGRKTYESIGKPLPNRFNIILTNKIHEYVRDLNILFCDFDYCLDFISNKQKEVFIIGGAEIYKLFYDYADNIYLTYINREYEGDAYFPFTLEEIEKDFIGEEIKDCGYYKFLNYIRRD